MIRRVALAAALAVAGLVPSRRASAQQPAPSGAAQCDMVNTGETRQNANQLPSGAYNVFMGAGVLVRCPTKGITIRADSLEYYGDERRVYLVGHASYAEPRFTLTSTYLTYYIPQERIVALQNVHATLPTGSSMDGQQLEYLRAVPRIRTRAQVTATQRPTARIVTKDSLGRAQAPVVVTANQIFMDGDSLLYAGGQVDIQREQLTARGDSAEMNSGAETMRLMRGPEIEGRKDRPFKLTGVVIDLYGAQKKLQRVISRGSATAVSQDMTLHSDTIDLRVDDDLLQRAVAWGKGRATAVSPTQRITADSIDVAMPDQKVREVHALRLALAEGRPDSVRFKADTTDWLRGDTIVARFDTVAAATRSRPILIDTTARRDTAVRNLPGGAVPLPSAAAPRPAARDRSNGPEIRDLVARGSASAFYHLAPSDTALRKPAISYSRGKQITVSFADRRVSTVVVLGKVAGMYAEPQADTAGRKATAGAAKGAAKPPASTAKPSNQRPPARPPATTTPRPPAREERR